MASFNVIGITCYKFTGKEFEIYLSRGLEGKVYREVAGEEGNAQLKAEAYYDRMLNDWRHNGEKIELYVWDWATETRTLIKTQTVDTEEPDFSFTF